MDGCPRVAVVGCGYWGAKHVRVFNETSNARLALVVDARPQRLSYVESVYPGLKTSADFGEALEDGIDGVVLATPISTHYHLARQALLAGKHVLVEKPLATTSAECRDLIAIAERSHLKLMVGHTFEYHPAILYLRDLIARGDLGDLYYIDLARLNLGLFQPDANVLWDLAPHDLSILFFLLNQTPRSVSAWGKSHILSGTPDVVHAALTFDQNISAYVHVSWLDPCKVRRATIVGSQAMVVFDDVAPTEKVRLYDKRFTLSSNGDRFADFQSSYHFGNVVIPPISSAEPLQLECQDFVNAMATGENVRADGHSGLRVVEALEVASRSMVRGGQIESFTSPLVGALIPPVFQTAAAALIQENGDAPVA